MKNILIIHKPFNKKLSIGIRHKHIIEFLLKHYNNVQCLSYNHVIKITKKDILSKPLKYKIIKYLFLKFFLPPASFDLNLNKFKKQIEEYLYINKTDMVFILIHPFFFLRLTNFIKKINPKIKIVVDMSDPYSEWIILLNYNFLSKILMKRFEKKFLKNIDTLIVLNYETKVYYEKYANNVVVIDQGVNHKDIENIREKETNITNSKIINLTYGGKFYKSIREPFELYKAIISSHQQLKLTIYSQLDTPYFIPHENEKINYTKAISQKELFEKYIQSDIIVFIDNLYGIQVPGKTIELLAFKKPILFIYDNEKSPTLNYVINQPGIYLAKNNSKLIKREIDKIINNIDKTYERDISKYYWNNLMLKLTEIINN